MLPLWATAGKKYTIPVDLGPAMPSTATKAPTDLTVTGYRLAWAAITSGRPPHLDASALTLAGREYRSWRIWASLGLMEAHGGNQLRRTQHFRALDATEKGHLNYALAGAVTKAYAAEKLRCRWLAHLTLAAKDSSYKAAFDPAIARRPDYIGLTDDHDFFVAEAKGRLSLRTALKDSLNSKEQTGAVTSVGGQAVTGRYGLAVASTHKATTLYVTDPDEDVRIDITANEWVQWYYRMLLDLSAAIDEDEPQAVPQSADTRGNAPWVPVRLLVPPILRQVALEGSGALEQWNDVEGRARQQIPQGAVINPDLTAFVAADNE